MLALSRRRLGALALLPALILTATACSSSAASSSKDADRGPAAELRLGYFANVTHATALVGVSKGFFADRLGTTKLSTQIFNAGPSAIEALFAGSLDAAFVGPNPAINGFVQSHGEALRIVAGAASGGASLVVQPGITDVSQLKGTTLATPQLGNTQDVALRAWLKDNGLATSVSGGGDVAIQVTDNATTLQQFRDKKIDGAWVPEPWASRLVIEGGGTVLLDERSLWPDGKFVVTNLVVATKFLQAHPQTVKALLEGELAADDWIAGNRADAENEVNAEIGRLTGKQLAPQVLTRAFDQIDLTVDPIAASLAADAQHAADVGLSKLADLHGIYDLTLLNQVLAASGKPAVADAGLSKKR